MGSMGDNTGQKGGQDTTAPKCMVRSASTRSLSLPSRIGPHLSGVCFANVEPTMAVGSLYNLNENPTSSSGATSPPAAVRSWPEGLGLTVWHCGDVSQSEAIMQGLANTREGPRLHLVCVDLALSAEEAADAVARQTEVLLGAFPGDTIQPVGLRPRGVPTRRLGAKQLKVSSAAQNVIAARRRLLTYECSIVPDLRMEGNHEVFLLPTECKKLQGVRLDYWQALRDTVGRRCVLFSWHHVEDLRTTLFEFAVHYTRSIASSGSVRDSIAQGNKSATIASLYGVLPPRAIAVRQQLVSLFHHGTAIAALDALLATSPRVKTGDAASVAARRNSDAASLASPRHFSLAGRLVKSPVGAWMPPARATRADRERSSSSTPPPMSSQSSMEPVSPDCDVKATVAHDPDIRPRSKSLFVPGEAKAGVPAQYTPLGAQQSNAEDAEVLATLCEVGRRWLFNEYESTHGVRRHCHHGTESRAIFCFHLIHLVNFSLFKSTYFPARRQGRLGLRSTYLSTFRKRFSYIRA